MKYETLVDSSYSLVQKSTQLLDNDDKTFGVFIHMPFKIGSFDNIVNKNFPMSTWDLFANIGDLVYFVIFVGSAILKPLQDHYDKLCYMKDFWVARTVNNKIFPRDVDHRPYLKQIKKLSNTKSQLTERHRVINFSISQWWQLFCLNCGK